MKNFKKINRSMRYEIQRITAILKQMEFRIIRMRGLIKARLRKEIFELKRIRNAILHKLREIKKSTTLNKEFMESLQDDIHRLHERCQQFKAQHFRG